MAWEGPAVPQTAPAETLLKEDVLLLLWTIPAPPVLGLCLVKGSLQLPAGSTLLSSPPPPHTLQCSKLQSRELTGLRQPCRGRKAASINQALMTQVERDSGALQKKSLLEFH